MATTQEVLTKAHELGKLLAEHDAARKLGDAVSALQDNTEAQRALNDFNRFVQTIAEKQANNQPIEVEEKRKLESLQNAVIRNRLLSKLQMAQMDYADLMRKVDEAIAGEGGVDPGDAPMPASGLVM